jgi:hypothetical protein
MDHEKSKPDKISLGLFLLFAILAAGIFWFAAGIVWYFDIGGAWHDFFLIAAALYGGFVIVSILIVVFGWAAILLGRRLRK